MKEAPPKTFILGINGSPHAEGVVRGLLRSVLDGAEKAGAETRVVDLYGLRIRHDPGLYSLDAKRASFAEMPDDDMSALYADIIRADGLVLATPVYWANMSGAMKDFIDRLTPLENNGYLLEGKLAAFIAASKENEGGIEMAAMSMVAALSQMGVLIPPNSVMWHPGNWVTAGGVREAWAEVDAPKVGRNMVMLIERLKARLIDWAAE